MQHNLHRHLSPFQLCTFVLNWQGDCEFPIAGGDNCHSCEPFESDGFCPVVYTSNSWWNKIIIVTRMVVACIFTEDFLHK